MSRHAVIRNGRVINVVEWDGGLSWAPPSGVQVVRHDEAGPGDFYDGTNFMRPPKDLAVMRRGLFNGFRQEAVRRIASVVPEWDSVEAIKAAVGMMRASGIRLTTEQKTARTIYLFAKDARAKLAALTTADELELVEPKADDPFGDGQVWPA